MRNPFLLMWIGFFIPLSFVTSSNAVAGESSGDFQKVVVPIGKIFSQFAATRESEETAHHFNLTRVYLGAKAQISPKIGGTIVFDVNRNGALDVTVPNYQYQLDENGDLVETEGTTTITYDKGYNRLTAFAKLAFTQVNDVVPGVNLQLGLVGTPWYSTEEAIWRHRYVAQVYADYWKALPTADLGVAAMGKIANGLLDYHLLFSNGEGFRKADDSVESNKNMAVRLSIAPLHSDENLVGLKLTLFGSSKLLTESPESTISALASLDSKKVTLAAGYLVTVTADDTKGGEFGWMVVHPMPKLHLVCRFDYFDPSKERDKDMENLVLAGITYDFVKGASLALDFQRLSEGTFAEMKNYQIAIHTELSF